MATVLGTQGSIAGCPDFAKIKSEVSGDCGCAAPIVCDGEHGARDEAEEIDKSGAAPNASDPLWVSLAGPGGGKGRRRWQRGTGRRSHLLGMD